MKGRGAATDLDGATFQREVALYRASDQLGWEVRVAVLEWAWVTPTGEVSARHETFYLVAYWGNPQPFAPIDEEVCIAAGPPIASQKSAESIAQWYAHVLLESRAGVYTTTHAATPDKLLKN